MLLTGLSYDHSREVAWGKVQAEAAREFLKIHGYNLLPKASHTCFPCPFCFCFSGLPASIDFYHPGGWYM
jgi:hypothetical protein